MIKDGATYVMYYAGARLERHGEDRTGHGARTERAVHARPEPGAGRRRRPSEFDATSVKDPVVVKAGAGDYRMLYTGVETLEGRQIERVGYATSSDGITWTKRGVVLGPSLSAYASDESEWRRPAC